MSEVRSQEINKVIAATCEIIPGNTISQQNRRLGALSHALTAMAQGSGVDYLTFIAACSSAWEETEKVGLVPIAKLQAEGQL